MVTIETKKTERIRLNLRAESKAKLALASKLTNRSMADIVDELVKKMELPRDAR